MSQDKALSIPAEALARAADEHDQHSQTAQSLQDRNTAAVQEAAQSYGPIGQPLSVALAISAARNQARTASAVESHARAGQLLREHQAGFHATEQENAAGLHKFSPGGAAGPNQPGGDGTGDHSANTTTFWGREGTQPLPGHSDPSSTTTTTLQHGGTATIHRPGDPLGPAGPSSLTSAPVTEAHKKQ